MEQINIDGRSVTILSQMNPHAKGSFLFIHGSGGNHQKWNDLMQVLPKHFNCISIDLPGHASSSGPLLKDISEGADFIYKLTDSLKLTRPLWLVGHSMGSAISIRVALDYPDQVDGLVLIGAGSRMRVLPSFLSALGEGNSDPNFMRAGFSATAPQSLVESELEAFSRVPVEVLFNDFSACNQFDCSNELSKINMPTLLITGEEDKLTPLKYAQFLKEHISGSELMTISEAGHMAMQEKPVEVSRAITSFVEKAARATH